MWKIPLLTVLQYLESDCNDLDPSQIAKVLNALAVISTHTSISGELEQAAENYRNENYSYTALKELMEKIVGYD